MNPSDVLKMNDAELLVELRKQAQQHRAAGNYERAKLTDDCIDMLEAKQQRAELTAEEQAARIENIKSIWRRMHEAIEGVI